jgi:hypothetical protein
MNYSDELEKKVAEIERLCREISDRNFLEGVEEELEEEVERNKDSVSSRFMKEIVSRIENIGLYDTVDSIVDKLYNIQKRLEEKEEEYDSYEYERSYLWKCHNL